MAEIDDELAAAFASAAAEIATTVLNSLSEEARKRVAARTQHDALYLHVQIYPQYLGVLALDSTDPVVPPFELARWTGAAPEEVMRALNQPAGD
jgi:hypothetical protein